MLDALTEFDATFHARDGRTKSSAYVQFRDLRSSRAKERGHSSGGKQLSSAPGVGRRCEAPRVATTSADVVAVAAVPSELMICGLELRPTMIPMALEWPGCSP